MPEAKLPRSKVLRPGGGCRGERASPSPGTAGLGPGVATGDKRSRGHGSGSPRAVGAETREGIEAIPTTAIDRGRIAAAHEVIRPYVRVTPVADVSGAELGIAGLETVRVALKLELLQHAGSFKTRGAFANLLLRNVPAAGVVAASGGNHGAAVAYAARRLGIPAKVFVPTISSPAKIARIREYGAQLTVGGERYAEALAAAELWAEQTGALPVHAFDQDETLLGQGTLGMELAAQVPDLETILVAVGGGGLIGGVAAWYAGSARIVGVEPEAAPTLTAALAAGRPVDAPAGGIAADSLAPRRVGELMFPIARAHVDRVVLVSDEAIRRAQRLLWDAMRIVAEPGGAAAFAALQCGAYRPAPGERVGVVVSGGNTTAVDFAGPSRA
jgi:threonine dehydratase